MTSGVESSSRRIPTLVQYCQRVAATHVDSISSLGDVLRYQLVKPILESCNAEHLLRLEQASPHLQKDTPEIWKDMCFRTYPSATEPYISGEAELDSWKHQYFILRKAEAKRLEEVGSRLRIQRIEADERKREREVKLTDRVPVAKRPRSGWSTNVQPKSLFQKTRSEASRIQKNMYHARMIPPMPNGKTHRILPNAPSAILPPVPSSNLPSRVTVNTVIRPRPSTTISPAISGGAKPTYTSTSSSLSAPSPLLSTPPSTSTSSPSSTTLLTNVSSFTLTSPSSSSSTPAKQCLPPNRISSQTSLVVPTNPRSLQAPVLQKKDRMATLFMPRHRAYSQRPR